MQMIRKCKRKGFEKSMWAHSEKCLSFVSYPFSILILFSFSIKFARCGEIC